MDCTDCNCIMYIHYIPWNYNDTCKIDIRKLIRRKSYENCSIDGYTETLEISAGTRSVNSERWKSMTEQRMKIHR